GFVPFSVPNQEIVVQFSETTSNEDTDAAITQIRAQLVLLGIEDVQIKQRADGSLKITYYSDVAVSLIQEAFARQHQDLFENVGVPHSNDTDVPFQEMADNFQFTVSEIGGGTDIYNGLKGHVLEIETKSSRFHPPEFFFTASLNAVNKEIKRTKISVLIYSQQTVVVAITSRLLPETRAGPIA
ncbi:MAG: hypothetical protein ACI97R_001754, partial [Candidatus Azotimanducaceae bacterium]